MIFDAAKAKIFIKPGSTDLRKGVSGLCILIEEDMKTTPFSGSLFLFCNKRRTLLKGIWWDKTGFWLCQKRLEKNKWPWPNTIAQCQELNEAELYMLLKGIDFWKAHKELFYSQVV